jgi:ABC-type dipeptide/oligopeptide/nickel transport system permease component
MEVLINVLVWGLAILFGATVLFVLAAMAVGIYKGIKEGRDED